MASADPTGRGKVNRLPTVSLGKSMNGLNAAAGAMEAGAVEEMGGGNIEPVESILEWGTYHERCTLTIPPF
jgi:hypothetical protein